MMISYFFSLRIYQILYQLGFFIFFEDNWPLNVDCNLQFEEERRLEIHKKVHDRKSKVSEHGSP